MIFTIGHERNYEKYLSEYSMLQKMGRQGDYCGGTVWKTYEEARSNCPVGFKVYGVLANWETDTEPSKTQTGANDLLVDSLLARIERR